MNGLARRWARLTGVGFVAIQPALHMATVAAGVGCPILGEISKRACLDHQGRKYSATNPLRVKLFRACKTCPNRRDS